MLIPAGVAVVAVVAVIFTAWWRERRTTQEVHGRLNDVISRMTSVVRELERRGELSDEPELGSDACQVISDCKAAKKESRPVMRDQLLAKKDKSGRDLFKRAERVEEAFNKLPEL